MRDPAIGGQLGAEPQCGEHLIAVVVLDDLSHGLQGHGVGIHLVRVHVVEGGGLGRISFEDSESQVSVMRTETGELR